MEHVITPDPHLVPGYTGHCPQARFRVGKTYGKLSHKLFIDPCINHAPDLIVNSTSKVRTVMEFPTERELTILKNREKFVDPVYRHPIIPGYDGFVPKLASKIGNRYIAAATAGVAEHEVLMDYIRCKQRFLEHGDLLRSGHGLFSPKLGERMIPNTKYRSPLIPIRKRFQNSKKQQCPYNPKKEPYSKYTVPHFMEDDDKEKFVVKGYSGHIPTATTRFGMSSKQLTHTALSEFSKDYHHRRSAEWCPIETAGVDTSCPNDGHFVLYHRTTGLLPCYAGHVPGANFKIGHTFGNATVDARSWLESHKD